MHSKKTKVVVVAPGPCDYIGCLNTGLAVNFEAKTTNDPYGLSLPQRSQHQLEWLRSVSHWIPAFYLVYWRKHEETRLHPVMSIRFARIKRMDGLPISGVRWLDVLWELIDNPQEDADERTA